MYKLETILSTNKMLKAILYFAFYIIINIIGLYLIIEGSDIPIKYSIGLSFVTISFGLFYFISCDFVHNLKVKKVFTIIGFVLFLIVTIKHLTIDISENALEVYKKILRCEAKNVLISGIAGASYIYSIVVGRIYKKLEENNTSENKKIIVQFLLPIICYVATVLFLFIGVVVFIVVIVFFILKDIFRLRRNINE